VLSFAIPLRLFALAVVFAAFVVFVVVVGIPAVYVESAGVAVALVVVVVALLASVGVCCPVLSPSCSSRLCS